MITIHIGIQIKAVIKYGLMEAFSLNIFSFLSFIVLGIPNKSDKIIIEKGILKTNHTIIKIKKPIIMFIT